MVTASETPSADNDRRPRQSRGRFWLAMGCCLTLFLLAFFCLSPRGLIVPIYVVSGSMAPALYGPSYKIRCESCRWSYRVGIESLPADGRVVCTNCGWQQTRTDKEKALPGSRVMVQRAASRSIGRWQVVAFRSPDDSRMIVKRLVGLPGEEINIQAGDLLANGIRIHKNLSEMQRVAILVHDDRFRPSNRAAQMTRWLPEATDSGWSAADNGYGWTAPRSEDDTNTAMVDWLSYQHAEGLPPPFRRGTPGPITDNYVYNQALSRRLNRVRDYFVSLRIEPQPSDQRRPDASNRQHNLRIHLKLPSEQASLTWNVAASTLIYSIFGSHDYVATFDAMEPPYQCVFGTWDRQLVLAINGAERLRRHLPGSIAANGQTDEAAGPAEWIAIGAGGTGSLALKDIQVWRDVYYLSPPRDALARGESWQLQPDEYLMLGDNSPLSYDARYGHKVGCVPRRHLVGTVSKW